MTTLTQKEVLDIAKRCGIKGPVDALVDFATLVEVAAARGARGPAVTREEAARYFGVPVEMLHPPKPCAGCDPAEGFCADCRAREAKAAEPLHPPGGQVDPCMALPHVRTAAQPEQASVCEACNGAGEYEHKGSDTRCRVCGGTGIGAALAIPASTAASELPPLPRTNYNGYGDGSEPLYTTDQMKQYARDAIALHTTPKEKQP